MKKLTIIKERLITDATEIYYKTTETQIRYDTFNNLVNEIRNNHPPLDVLREIVIY